MQINTDSKVFGNKTNLYMIKLMERGTDLFKSGFAMTKQIVKDSGTRTHNNGYLIQNNTIILGW